MVRKACERFIGGSLDHWPEICDKCGRPYSEHEEVPLVNNAREIMPDKPEGE